MKKRNKKNNLKLIWVPRTLAVLYILILTWKKQKFAGILFGLFGITTIIFYNTYQGILNFSMISLPPILAGILFYFLKNPKH
jgi:hypothetical protein